MAVTSPPPTMTPLDADNLWAYWWNPFEGEEEVVPNYDDVQDWETRGTCAPLPRVLTSAPMG